MEIAREQPEEEGEESYGPIGDLVEGRNDTNQNTTKYRAKLMKSCSNGISVSCANCHTLSLSILSKQVCFTILVVVRYLKVT